jgi:hypothetical protein
MCAASAALQPGLSTGDTPDQSRLQIWIRRLCGIHLLSFRSSEELLRYEPTVTIDRTSVCCVTTAWLFFIDLFPKAAGVSS